MTLLQRAAYLNTIRLFSRNARLFLVSQGLAGLGIGIFGLLFNLYLVRLGFREDFIGQVAGMTTLAQGLAAIPAGLLADRIGRRPTMLAGAIIIAVGYLGQITLLHPLAIVLLGVFAGSGMALIIISMNPFMTENSSQQERPHLFALSSALMMLTTMLGNLVGGTLPRLWAQTLGWDVADPLSYRAALWVAIILLALTAVPFYLLHEKRLQRARRDASTAEADAPDHEVRRRMAIFVAVNVLLGMGAGAIIPFFNVFFLKRFALSTESVGLIFSINYALIGVAMLFGPALVKRVGKLATVAGGLVSGVPFLGILAATSDARVAALAFWGRSIGINMTDPQYAAFRMEMVPAHLRGTLSGLTSTGWNVSWAVSSTLGGSLILALGYSWVFVLAAGFYLAAGLVFFVAFRGHRSA